MKHSDDIKSMVNSRAWFQIALNHAKEIDVSPFSSEKLKSYLPEIREMTTKDPSSFLPRLKQIFSECGVAFVILPHLKNSGINGAVKWINTDKVVLAMNDRKKYADTFWFSLFHEIQHVLQQKIKTVFVSCIDNISQFDKQLEDEADKFAQDYLIPPKEYLKFCPTKYTSDNEIISFAERIGIHPGIVAGRMQHDGIISQSRCTKLKDKYIVL